MLKKSKKQKNKRKIANNYIGMAAISGVALILLGSLAVESVNMRGQVAVYDARAAELEEKIENEKSVQRRLTRRKNIWKRTNMPPRWPETGWGL